MAIIQAKFVLERETKGALLFKEVDSKGNLYSAPNAPGCQIGNIYVRKSALDSPSTNPEEITLTITFKD